MPDVAGLKLILDRVAMLSCRPARRAVLVGISGIDGAGKGFVAAQLADGLVAASSPPALRRRVAIIGIDDWHARRQVLRRDISPGEAFYEGGLRLAECFDRVVRPLARDGVVRVEAEAIGPDGRAWRKVHEHGPVDVVIVEGVFIFRRELRPEFDLAVWVDCTFETALERAIARNQEGLSEAAIRREYETIYFPAQRRHAEVDRPREGADVVVVNDRRLEGTKGRGDEGTG